MLLELQLVIVAILIALSGYFSASEIALVSLSQAKVRQMTAKHRIGATYVKRLKESPQRMLSTILIGNNVVNTAAAAMMTSIMIKVLDSYAVGIATGIMTLLILVFGEITPKTLAVHHNERAALFFAPPLWYLSVVLRPILAVLDWVLSGIFRLFGMKAQQVGITEDEIKHMVSAAEEEGSIKEIERDLIHNVFSFDELTAGDIATPRSDIIMVHADATVQDALRLIAERKHSRIPVFDTGPDDIVGVVYLKDLVAKHPFTRLRKAMKKPYFVPESKRISNLLQRFQKRKEHLALVVDEYGHVTGLITLEDVLEEIVGDIVDESERTKVHIRSRGKNTWFAKGRTTVDELNGRLGMKLKDDDYDTIGGLIMHRLGRIPVVGDSVMQGRFRLTVHEVDHRRVATVKIEKKRS